MKESSLANYRNKKCNMLLNTGSAFGTREYNKFPYTKDIHLHAGVNKISLLSVAVGLPVSSLTLLSSFFRHYIIRKNATSKRK